MNSCNFLSNSVAIFNQQQQFCLYLEIISRKIEDDKESYFILFFEYLCSQCFSKHCTIVVNHCLLEIIISFLISRYTENCVNNVVTSLVPNERSVHKTVVDRNEL